MKKLKAQIEKDIQSHAVFACHDLQASLASIDFIALASSQDNKEPGYNIQGNTAVINVRGLLVPKTSSDYSNWGVTGYNNIAAYLERANNDPLIDDIRLDVDSGGGYVAGLDDVIEQIANLNKPINTFVSGNMYSAAYWLGASAKKITAQKSSGIGSIGVFVVHNESSKALEQWGETFSIFRSGKWKGAFNWFSPLTKHEKERLQQGVDETASLFFNHVASQRKITAQQVKDWEGDVFTAEQAKELGLIDEIVGKVPAAATQVEQETHADQSATLTQNPTKPMEDSMDLEQAKAKISELQGQVADKDGALTKATKERDEAVAEATKAKAELEQLKGNARQKAIDALAQATGQTFDDAQLAELKGASDGVFAMLEKAYTDAAKKPSLPSSWKTEQANTGASPDKQSKDDIIRAEIAKAKGGN